MADITKYLLNYNLKNNEKIKKNKYSCLDKNNLKWNPA